MDSIPLGILIPVFNEAENIGNTLASIRYRITTPNKIYIIYDFDEDNTLPIAKKYLNQGMRIQFLSNPQEGAINAIRTGLKKAKEEYLLVTMADTSDDYAIVDKMCDLMNAGYDLVCGSRYIRGGKQIGGPFMKKTLSRLVGISLKHLAGLPTHDVTNSFKLYRKSMIDAIDIESDGGFEIGMEIVIKAHFSGFKVTEVPCIWMGREKGKSRFKIMKWAPHYLRWYLHAIGKRFNSCEPHK